MKLKEFRVREFRSIWDSGPVKVDLQTTCLVGKNEAGKGLPCYVFNSLIWPRAPKYLYFDEYYQMEGQANLNALIAREDAKQLKDSDYLRYHSRPS